MKKDLADLHLEGRLPASPEDFPDAPTPGAPSSSSALARWTPLSKFENVFSEKPRPRAWLLQRDDLDKAGPDPSRDEKAIGVLPRGKVGMLAAGGGVGKTMALCQLAIAVATGTRWLASTGARPGELGAGFITPKDGGRVLLALGEEDAEEVQRRMFNAGKNLSGEQQRKALERIVVMPLAGVAVGLIEETGHAPLLEELRARLNAENEGWALLVLDPLSRFAGLDTEKDNAAATRFVQAVETLVTVSGSPTVLLAHHTNKTARNKSSTARDTENSGARGASGLTDAVRWVADLDADGKGHAWLEVKKTNYSAPMDAVLLVRDGENGGALRAATAADQARKTADEAASKAAEDAKKPPKARTASGAPIGDNDV